MLSEDQSPGVVEEGVTHAPVPVTNTAMRRGSAILTACAILALPIAYLFLHHAPTTAVQAGAPQTPAASAANLPTLEAAVRSNPTSTNKINLSLGYINAGQQGRAVTVLEALTTDDPKNANAWNNLCVAHTLQLAYKDGIDDCGKALAIKPDFQLAKNNLKWAQGERDKTVAAITLLEQTGPDKRDATFYLTEGLDYLHVGNYDEAVHAWQRMLSIDPKSAIAANNIGIAMMMQKQPSSAIPWFQKALVFDPAMGLAKNNLAWAQSLNGK